MTTLDVLYRYETQPTVQAIQALTSAREVYGIRRLIIDRASKVLRIEYDATRLNAATVARIVRQAGVEIAEELPPAALALPEEEPAAAPAA
jgi:hypothetical protein